MIRYDTRQNKWTGNALLLPAYLLAPIAFMFMEVMTIKLWAIRVTGTAEYFQSEGPVSALHYLIFSTLTAAGQRVKYLRFWAW